MLKPPKISRRTTPVTSTYRYSVIEQSSKTNSFTLLLSLVTQGACIAADGARVPTHLRTWQAPFSPGQAGKRYRRYVLCPHSYMP